MITDTDQALAFSRRATTSFLDAVVLRHPWKLIDWGSAVRCSTETQSTHADIIAPINGVPATRTTIAQSVQC